MEQIIGAIDFAEYLSENVCEETGNNGQLCVRGNWYKTLCVEKAKELGYIVAREE